jgi:hypothetical protein
MTVVEIPWDKADGCKWWLYKWLGPEWGQSKKYSTDVVYKYSGDYSSRYYRVEFQSEKDAMWFTLNWS